MNSNIQNPQSTRLEEVTEVISHKLGGVALGLFGLALIRVGTDPELLNQLQQTHPETLPVIAHLMTGVGLVSEASAISNFFKKPTHRSSN